MHQEYEWMRWITQSKIINLFGLVIQRKFGRFIKKKRFSRANGFFTHLLKNLETTERSHLWRDDRTDAEIGLYGSYL